MFKGIYKMGAPYYSLKYLDLKLLDVVTNHPVHIVDAEGRISPSALIPFCDVGGNMSALGQDIQGFSLPVCTAFKRIIFNDQLCYQVNLTQYQDRVERSQVYEKGISFVIDTNEDRQYSDKEITTTEDTQHNLGINSFNTFELELLHFLMIILYLVSNFIKFKDSQNFLIYIGLLGKCLLTKI